MKHYIENSFNVKLDFQPKTEDPSRLFRSFAEMIDGIAVYDLIIAKSVNSSVVGRIILDDLKTGSLIGSFVDALTINDNEKFDDINDDKIKIYLNDSRDLGVRFVSSKKHTIEDIKELNNQIIDLAKNNEIDKMFNYYEPDLLELSKGINKIGLSTNELKEEENYTFRSKDQTIIIDNQSKQIDIEKLEDALTDKVIQNTVELIYKIKKPDFLGDSQWEFKLGKSTPKAKILHEVWLEKFHSGEIVVVPGDALQVKVFQCFKYNKHGVLISEKLEIIEVIDIIHNRDTQKAIDDED